MLSHVNHMQRAQRARDSMPIYKVLVYLFNDFNIVPIDFQTDFLPSF